MVAIAKTEVDEPLLGRRACARHRIHLQGVREGRGVGAGRALGLVGRATRRSCRPARRYDNRFRTHPDPTAPAPSLTFAVIGDFGVGVKDDIAERGASSRSPTRCGARSTPKTCASCSRPATTSTRGSKLLGIPIGAHRRRRRRLVLHLLPAVPLHHQPHSGVSVDRQSRRRRIRGARRSRAGRGQLLLCASASPAKKRRAARRSGRGCSTASATAPTSSSSASTRRRRASSRGTGCSSFRSTGTFVEAVVSARRRAARCGASRSRTIRRSAPGRSITTREAMDAAAAAVRARRRARDVQRPRAQLPALAGRRHRLLRDRRRRQVPRRAARSASTRRTRVSWSDRLSLPAGADRGRPHDACARSAGATMRRRPWSTSSAGRRTARR